MMDGGRESLGAVVHAFEPAPTPRWQVVGGVIVGGAVIAIAVASGVLGLIALGAAMVVLSPVLPWWTRETSGVAAIHVNGLRLRDRRWHPWQPPSSRRIRWDEIAGYRAVYRMVRVSSRVKVPDHRGVIELAEGGSLELTMSTCPRASELIRSLELTLGSRFTPELDAYLAAGGIITVGTLHLRRDGWIVDGNTLRWRALRRIQHASDHIFVDLDPIGRRSIGPYKELPTACTLLSYVADKARADGGEVNMFDDLPIELA